MKVKKCKACDEEKVTSFENFHKDKLRPDGLYPYCKLCTRKMSRARYNLNPTYRTPSSATLRKEVKALKLKTGCVDCGYNTHPDALQFDHLPQFEKVGNLSSLVNTGNKELVMREIAKCEVVCANCHAIRTANRPQKIKKKMQDNDISLGKYRKPRGWKTSLPT